MPDITMCKGNYCPIKDKCYRYTASPTKDYQSYFTETPGEISDENKWECDYYWGQEGERGYNQLKDITK